MDIEPSLLAKIMVVSVSIAAATSGPLAFGGSSYDSFSHDHASVGGKFWRSPVPNVISVSLNLYSLNDGAIPLDHPNLLGGWAASRSEGFLEMTRTISAKNPQIKVVHFTRVDRSISPFDRVPSVMVLPLLINPTKVERETNIAVGLDVDVRSHPRSGHFGNYMVFDATQQFLAQVMTQLRRGYIIRAHNLARKAFDNLDDSGGVLTPVGPRDRRAPAE